MRAIMKREIKNYLKNPVFWVGMLIMAVGVFQQLNSYLKIHYVSSQQELEQYADVPPWEGDISQGYIPAGPKERRDAWEEKMRISLVNDFLMSEEEAEAVLSEMKEMEVQEACKYLEEQYGYYGAIYYYEETQYRQGSMEEVNDYIESKLREHRFSYYFSRKFADFAGLFMFFFATIMLAVLFLQDTRKNTYELLHTKPVSAWGYVGGKIAGGFSVCLISLIILILLFWAACFIYTRGNGFEVNLLDFAGAACLYILPNMLMVVCVYGLTALLFKTPLPAVPVLFLYMVYSNMGSRNAEGVYGYYGRPLAIMVRFPGQFFDTAPPPLVLLNQSFLLLASAGIIFLSVQLWRRRRL